MIKIRRNIRTSISVFAVMIFMSGCASYNSKSSSFITPWKSGNIALATSEIDKFAESKGDSKDGLLLYLEQGAVNRASGDYARSNAALDVAEEKISVIDGEADISIGESAGSTMTNQTQTKYRGYAYDRVMMNTYKALNFMQLNDTENVRVELERAIQKQEDAKIKYQKAIDKAEKKSEEEEEEKYDEDKARNDPKFADAYSSNFDYLEGVKFYSDYENPFTVFFDGLFYKYNYAGASGLERALDSFKRVHVMLDEKNPYLLEDIKDVEAVINGATPEPLVYVIFENGLAPIREEVRIDIPTFIVSSKVPYVGAAFPKLARQSSSGIGLTVSSMGKAYQINELANMNTVIEHEFNNLLPGVITRTLISTVAKATAQYFAQKAAEEKSDSLGLFMQIAGGMVQAGLNSADLRTWGTLPQQFLYSRFPRPANGEITLRPSVGLETVIALDPGTVNVVYVKSMTPQSGLFVSQFKLK